MNTNDEQASYGSDMFPEPKRDNVGSNPFTPIVEAVAKNIAAGRDPFTPKEEPRAPMLSDEEIRIIMDEEAEDCGVDDYTAEGKIEWRGMLSGAKAIRDHYESLITKGVLRVVKADKGTVVCSCRPRVITK